jgi:hypothetical protein
MASALDTIAHIVLPNLMKLKGVGPIVTAMERRDVSMFQSVWDQCGVSHKPEVVAKDKDAWRIGVMSLPAPKEMGEAYLCGFIAKKNDAAITRYFTLEHDYVLSTKATRTQLCEREGQRMRKIAEGPAISGDFQKDANAFIDAIMAVLEPVVTNDPNRSYK